MAKVKTDTDYLQDALSTFNITSMVWLEKRIYW